MKSFVEAILMKPVEAFRREPAKAYQLNPVAAFLKIAEAFLVKPPKQFAAARVRSSPRGDFC